jgi:hypothetical protein
MRALYRLTARKSFRADVIRKVFGGARQVHQISAVTALDRYPDIFQACVTYMKGNPSPNILSYGCSTGEEVVTLRHYFPGAKLVGAEINPYSLEQCLERKVDPDIQFVKPGRRLQRLAPFDAIFCMAVLQKSPHLIVEQNILDLKPIYGFAKFDEKLQELDALLKPSGLLIVEYAQYSVEDSSIFSKYVALDFDSRRKDYPRFAPDGLRRTAASGGIIFLKSQI